MVGKIEGGRKRRRQRMRWLDGITDMMKWVWAGSRSWWWTGKPGVLQTTIFSLLQIWRNHHVHIGFAECGSMWVTELNWRANWYSNNSVTGKSHYYCCHFSRSNNLTNSVNHPLPTHICTALTAMNFPWTFNPNKDCTRSCCGLPFTSEETALARGLDSHLEKGGPDLGSEPRAVPCHCQASWDGHHTLTGSQCLDFP